MLQPGLMIIQEQNRWASVASSRLTTGPPLGSPGQVNCSSTLIKTINCWIVEDYYQQDKGNSISCHCLN